MAPGPQLRCVPTTPRLFLLLISYIVPSTRTHHFLEFLVSGLQQELLLFLSDVSLSSSRRRQRLLRKLKLTPSCGACRIKFQSRYAARFSDTLHASDQHTRSWKMNLRLQMLRHTIAAAAPALGNTWPSAVDESALVTSINRTLYLRHLTIGSIDEGQHFRWPTEVQLPHLEELKFHTIEDRRIFGTLVS